MNESQKWFWLTALLVFSGVIYLLAPMLTPFLFSALLAYLGDPVVDRIERLGLSRTVGVIIVFTVMLFVGISALLGVIPALERQIVVVIAKTPQAIDWIQDWLLPRVSSRLGIVLSIDTATLKQSLVAHWQELGTVVQQVVMHLGRSGQMVLGWLSFLFLVPVVTFYLLRDWDHLVRHIDDLLPRKIVPTVRVIAGEIDAVLAEFLRGQLTVMLALALLYTVGLGLIGLDLAIAIGISAGMVSFVPYLGVIVGVLLAGIAALLQFGDAWHVLAVVAVFGIGQILEGMVLSPLLVGDRIGLHPVAVIFAVMAGGQLFGFFGVLVALPVAAAIVVLLRHSQTEYRRSEYYATEIPLPTETE
ncbi:MAG: AI-2E family transporter [Gammaproteobacteria bacterium]|nr:AI-2E family transporter [Gammaproteobacteria bacterium]